LSLENGEKNRHFSRFSHYEKMVKCKKYPKMLGKILAKSCKKGYACKE
jgi:hypothetical protein